MGLTNLFLFIYLFIRLYWMQLIVLAFFIVVFFFLIKNLVKKNKKRIWIFSSVIVAIILLSVAFYVIFPSNFPYVDMWIYGKTSEEIQAIYGEPHYDGHGMICYRTEWQFLDYNYYCIEFDESGKAVEIYEALTPWPGG